LNGKPGQSASGCRAGAAKRKGIKSCASSVDSLDAGPLRQDELEEARAFNLRYQVDVGQRRRSAEAEGAALGIGSEQRFEGFKAGADPGAAPSADGKLVVEQVVAKVAKSGG
jgi:hypothetical protein